jgi:hypothetical protein
VNLFTLMLVAALVAFAAGVVLGRRIGGWGAFAAALLAPVVLTLAADAGYHLVWNPNAGCSDECWGGLIYGAAWVGAVAGAELGLMVGAVTASARRARDRRASSP